MSIFAISASNPISFKMQSFNYSKGLFGFMNFGKDGKERRKWEIKYFFEVFGQVDFKEGKLIGHDFTNPPKCYLPNLGRK